MYWGLAWIIQSARHGFFWRAECLFQEILLAAYCYSDFLWESAEQKLNKEKDESGGWSGEAEERWKHTSVKELWVRRNGKQRQRAVRAQLTRVSLNMLGVLYLSISAGWNWLLFYSIPSEEASPVLVLSNWRVMSVSTSVSGKCVKYSNIKWSPFYSSFSSLHCFLPDGVSLTFSKAFDTVLSIGCFFN